MIRKFYDLIHYNGLSKIQIYSVYSKKRSFLLCVRKQSSMKKIKNIQWKFNEFHVIRLESSILFNKWPLNVCHLTHLNVHEYFVFLRKLVYITKIYPFFVSFSFFEEVTLTKCYKICLFFKKERSSYTYKIL